jgi:hypothetical protein
MMTTDHAPDELVVAPLMVAAVEPGRLIPPTDLKAEDLLELSKVFRTDDTLHSFDLILHRQDVSALVHALVAQYGAGAVQDALNEAK